MNKNTFDPIGYEPVIKQAFPHAMISKIANYDDFSYGWYICPEPKVTIRFLVNSNDDLRFGITVFKIYDGLDESLTCKRIFYGTLPADDEKMEPDFDFVKKMLLNWRSFV